jgi:2-haloacid dehalogenase
VPFSGSEVKERPNHPFRTGLREPTSAKRLQYTDGSYRVWHRLKPWPDSVAGLTRLKKPYTIAPLSNGNVALFTAMAKAKGAGIPWDLILSAELARHYKPDHEAYLTAVSLLELKPEEVMMCAAHSTDPIAARDCGLRTGFIHRPDEFGSMRRADEANPGDFDVVSSDMLDFASKLGA